MRHLVLIVWFIFQSWNLKHKCAWLLAIAFIIWVYWWFCFSCRLQKLHRRVQRKFRPMHATSTLQCPRHRVALSLMSRRESLQTPKSLWCLGKMALARQPSFVCWWAGIPLFPSSRLCTCIFKRRILQFSLNGMDTPDVTIGRFLCFQATRCSLVANMWVESSWLMPSHCEADMADDAWTCNRQVCWNQMKLMIVMWRFQNSMCRTSHRRSVQNLHQQWGIFCTKR